MEKSISFVVFYEKTNIYSFNALIGALETESGLKDIDLIFVRGVEDLITKLEELVKIYKKVIIGISFFTTQIWNIFQLLKKLRKRYDKDIFIIAGGPHPTGDPQGTLKMGFDLVVVGEGEETLIELLLNIKSDEPINNVKGIAYLNNDNNYIFTGKRKPINLDKYPPLPMKNVKFGAIEITRGCPYVCYFCQTPYIFGTKPRHRSINAICDAVRFMHHFNKTDIRFITPNAFSYGSIDGKKLNLSKLEELLSEIKQITSPDGKIFLGSFPSEVRPEHVTPESLKLINLYAANDNIVIGAQSGSQRILNLCHRGHTVEDIYNAVNLTIQSNLKANVDFIFGLPYETEKDISLTLEFIKELTNIGARIHTHSFLPLPQTVFASMNAKRINKNVRRCLNKLNSKGLVYGEWKKQEKMALKLAQYFKSKKIKDLF